MKRYPFFVYGTLLPGQPNHFLLADGIDTTQAAILPAAMLFDMDGFPMLLEGGDQAVNGLVIDVKDVHYEAVMASLDELEGVNLTNRSESLYLREKRQVQLMDGSLRVAWVYIGRTHLVQGKQPFGGDWLTYSAEIGRNVDAWWQEYRNTPNAHLFDREHTETPA